MMAQEWPQSPPQQPSGRRSILVRVSHFPKARKVSWYAPCEPAAIDSMLRAVCGIAPLQQYLLLDSSNAAVAVSSSLPADQTYEVFILGSASGAADSRPPAIAIIDPISTGAVLAKRLYDLGYAIVRVWSDVVPEELKTFVDPRATIKFAATVMHSTGAVAVTAAELLALDVEVREVMVGCETGVLLGDLLSETLSLRGNGTARSRERRNKFYQTEALRTAGLNACGQMLANSMEDVEQFLRERPKTNPFKAVVKPVEGAGSDGVFICDSPEAVRTGFTTLEGTKNVLGLTNYSVLLQEYLRGDEYVVDTVSRSGVHKCVAIWKYDKRMFNGSPVVYFGIRLMSVDDEPQLRAMVEYTFKVLDALGIQNGSVHSELKTEERGPVLIEANCRLHGGEGTWTPMVETCLGYSQVSAMIDAYLDPPAFAAIPAYPDNFKAFATEADMQSNVSGILKEVDPEALAKIKALSSYRDGFLAVTVGERIEKTIDLLTSCGNFNLVNQSKEQLDADYEEFHRIVGKGIFRVE